VLAGEKGVCGGGVVNVADSFVAVMIKVTAALIISVLFVIIWS
jgi:hypothetical protein